MASTPKYKRVLLKLSGESFCLPGGFGIDPQAVTQVVDELIPIVEMGIQVGLVVGGGNIVRGKTLTAKSEAADSINIQRGTADYMGMLATVINALALRDALTSRGISTRVQSAVTLTAIAEPFIQLRAIRHLEKGRIVIFAAGTGSPFFTTDTCAALRAREIGAQVLLKATKVDGVFDCDPATNSDAKKYDKLSYHKVITDQLGVMDMTAISMCMESKIPIIVFQLSKAGSLAEVICGKDVGTLVTE